MPPTKMLDYHNWRINIKNKSFSRILEGTEQSFYQTLLKSGGWMGDNKAAGLLQAEKGGPINMVKRVNEKEFKKLVHELKKMCEKERFFRKDKVAKIKKLIKNKQYHVSGKQVVDKWFPDDSAF